MDQDKIYGLATAVSRWLSYQRLCGREELLSEAYLSHPVGEYLNYHHSGKFICEYNHPIFKKSKAGRPKQIDYVLLTRYSKNVEIAVECKWISNTPYDKQRIINDVLRLECLRTPRKHVKRYFLVAGLKGNFKVNFRDLEVNIGSSRMFFTKNILSFSMKYPEKTVCPTKSNRRMKDYYKSFIDSYDISVPINYKTKLVARRTVDDIYVLMWNISCVPKRATINIHMAV